MNTFLSPQQVLILNEILDAAPEEIERIKAHLEEGKFAVTTFFATKEDCDSFYAAIRLTQDSHLPFKIVEA